MVGNPIKMSEMGEEVHKGAPTLGEHTDEILAGYLGYTALEIEDLRKKGII